MNHKHAETQNLTEQTKQHATNATSAFHCAQCPGVNTNQIIQIIKDLSRNYNYWNVL